VESPLASATTSTTGQEEDRAMEKLESKLTSRWFVLSAELRKPPAQLAAQL